jgi:hypothetical protein
MKRKDRINERKYDGHLTTMLTSAFNTELQPLRSLKTATKRRRAMRKRVEKDVELPTSVAPAPGQS